jgi:Fic family protein
MTSPNLPFTWESGALNFPLPAREPKKPAFMLRKLMAQYVFDLVHLEGNKFSFVEVQTLLDGETIGGHRLADHNQVIAQHKSLLFLLETLKHPLEQQLTWQELACALHARLAREEALVWGKFRSGQVRISGTHYLPPAAENLADLYAAGSAQIALVPHPFERALAYFFWGALMQFFYDGNKRCARAMMNHMLLSHGYFYLSVPALKREAFDQMMVDFYDSKDASAGMAFMLACYQTWD